MTDARQKGSAPTEGGGCPRRRCPRARRVIAQAKISDLVCRRVVLLVGGKLTHRATNLVPPSTCGRIQTSVVSPMHHTSSIALQGVQAHALEAHLPTHHATGPPRAAPAQSVPWRGSAPTHHTPPSIRPPWRRCDVARKAGEGARDLLEAALPLCFEQSAWRSRAAIARDRPSPSRRATADGRHGNPELGALSAGSTMLWGPPNGRT